MTTEEYETAIGKLVILKVFLTHQHHGAIDEVIESLTTEYVDRFISNKL